MYIYPSIHLHSVFPKGSQNVNRANDNCGKMTHTRMMNGIFAVVDIFNYRAVILLIKHYYAIINFTLKGLKGNFMLLI